MKTLAFISFIIFIGYILFILFRFGLLPSISQSYYALEGEKKGLGVVFYLVFMTMIFTLIPYWLEITSENTQFIAFLSAAGLGFVGAAPAFKLDLEGKVHVISAKACAVFSVLWIVFNSTLPIIIVTLSLYPIAFMLIRLLGNKTYFLEMAAFLGLYIAILLK